MVGILVFLVMVLGASTGLFKDMTGYTTLKNSQPTTTLISPGNNQLVYTDKIVFNWNYNDPENDPQTAFILQIDKTRRMENPTSKMVSSPSNSYIFTIKNPKKTTYYWRVKTRDANGWGEWSRPSSFSLDLNIKECSDGTPLWQCSLDKPKWCYTVFNTPVLVDKCSKCGCPAGYTCQKEECEPISCIDGTPHGECSIELPKYCDKGNLVYNCEKCGCLLGKACQTDGTCSIPAIFRF